MDHIPNAAHLAAGREIGNVLVLEDDPVVGLALAEALRAAGARSVETCATMYAALGTLERLTPDVVVLDVRLADRSDGWAFVELLPLLGPRGPQVIFATGSPDLIPAEIAARGTVLAKPFAPDELLALIRQGQPGPGLVERLRGAFSGNH